MSADISRRDFIGSLAAAAVLPSAGSALALPDDWFEDLRPDMYYTLQGGPYKDTGGWGYPYSGMCDMLVETLKDWDHCRMLDDCLAEVE